MRHCKNGVWSMAKFDELKFIRIYDFNLVPRYLMEQVKGGEVNIDHVIAFGSNLAKDPLTLLYALADGQNRIKGFLWAAVDVFEECIHVNALSVDREYQDKPGVALLKSAEFLKQQMEGSKLKRKITFATNRPRAFERVGFKRTELVNMEIE